jgi:hypothetical protein
MAAPPAEAFEKKYDDIDHDPSKETTTTAKSNKKNDTSNGSSLRQRKPTATSQNKDSSVANSAVPAAYSRANLASTRNGVSMPSSSSDTSSPQATTAYWLRYWYIYGFVHAVGLFCSMIPIFPRIFKLVLGRYPIFYLLTDEIKLLFFVWILGMEYFLRNMTMTSATTTTNKADTSLLAEALPLTLMKRYVTPLLLQIHEKVSEAVSEPKWNNSYIISLVKRVLEAFVLIRVCSKETKDRLVHVAEELRVIAVPSITLFMPGMITQFGLLYVQYIVPSSKSAQARSDSVKLVYLEYWIIHCIVNGILAWFSNILWYIPFSTHLIYVLWCYLYMPKHIRQVYEIVEDELVAFGILKGNDFSSVDVNRTKTAKLFNALTARLPSASSDVNYGEENKQQLEEPPVNNANNDDKLQAKKNEDSGDDSLPDLATKTSSAHEESDEVVEADESSTAAPSRRSAHKSTLIHAKVE